LFSVFQAENRRWLALVHRNLEEGLSHLWSSVAVVLNGLAAKPGAQKPASAVLRQIIRELR
jgi:hypothetical protein